MKSIFSKRLKEERLENNLTQQQLSDLINEERKEFDGSDLKISRVSITRYENGTRTPDYNTLCIISHILNTDLDYLLGKSNSKHITDVNEELVDFINSINKISETDDKNTNDSLWEIISHCKDLIVNSAKNNLLEKVYDLMMIINASVSFSLNTKNPKIVDDLKKIMTMYMKYINNNSYLELLLNQLDECKKDEREILIDLNKSANVNKAKSISEEMLNKNRKEQKKLQQEILQIREERKKVEDLLYK